MRFDDRASEESGILAELRQGDPDAIDAWFRSEHPRVYRICFGLLGNHEEAEDLASEAMYRILDRIDAIEPRGRLRPWSTTIVTNLCRDRLRRRARRGTTATLDSELPDRLPEAPAKLEQEELRRLIAASLARLPEREREAFVLVELEGMPTDEAAESLGVLPGSIRSQLSLARSRLRKIIGRRLADSGKELP